MSLTTKEKENITLALQAYVRRYPSQNKAAASLRGVSAATLSAILSGKTENISADMWRNIAAQTSAASSSDEWQIVETLAFKDITLALQDAQEYKNVHWVVGEAGIGKTTAARDYAEKGREVYYILCSEDMKRGDFVREIARTVGIKPEGYNLRELWGHILDALVRQTEPLLIFDEADKLTETVFQYFISLYNRLEDRCGMVFFSTDHIKTRIQRGLRFNKVGYKEFFSRIGRKFYELANTSAYDVYAVCAANGLTDQGEIDATVRESEEADYDLRRVKKIVHRTKRLRNLKPPK